MGTTTATCGRLDRSYRYSAMVAAFGMKRRLILAYGQEKLAEKENTMSNLEAKDSHDILVQEQGGGAVMKRLILLLAAAIAVLVFALPGFAQSSYTWQIDCRDAAANGSAATGVTWAWLHDGVQISLTSPPNGFAACVGTPLSGSGVIPASINGIQVNGIAVTLLVSEFPAGCQAFASVTKSFDPSDPKISISDSVSAPKQVQFSRFVGGGKVDCPSASFSFSLSTT